MGCGCGDCVAGYLGFVWVVGRFFLRGWWFCFGSCGVCVMLGYCGFDSGCRHVVIVGA